MRDDTMRQFAAEMERSKPLRPSGTRHDRVNMLSGAGAAVLAQRIRDFWRVAGFESRPRSSGRPWRGEAR
jgi:hypothetical protein